MRTVLQVIPALDAGGAERTTVDIAHAVAAAGGTALIATRGGRLAEAATAGGGEILKMPVDTKNPAMMAANAIGLARTIRRRSVDIVHARSRAPAWSALLAARMTGARFVTTYHGVYAARTAPKRFYNSVMARGDVVIANSSYTADLIRQTYRVDPARLSVIPRGVDLAQFSPSAVSEARVAQLRAAWALPSGAEPIVLLPARLTSWKGHAVALKAFARVAAGAGDAAHMVFCGDAQGRDDYRAALARETAELGLAGSVSIVGHCDDMPAAYALADIILAPSTRPEAFGRTAAEAGAMAKPVVAADHGGARETVDDGATGILTAPGDVVGLFEALDGLLNAEPTARAAMGAKARQKISADFSVEAMCAATLAAYDRLTAMGRR